MATPLFGFGFFSGGGGGGGGGGGSLDPRPYPGEEGSGE